MKKLNECQAAFEAWAQTRYMTHGYTLEKAVYPKSCEGFTYEHNLTDKAWIAWQGAWALLSPLLHGREAIVKEFQRITDAVEEYNYANNKQLPMYDRRNALNEALRRTQDASDPEARVLTGATGGRQANRFWPNGA